MYPTLLHKIQLCTSKGVKVITVSYKGKTDVELHNRTNGPTVLRTIPTLHDEFTSLLLSWHTTADYCSGDASLPRSDTFPMLTCLVQEQGQVKSKGYEVVVGLPLHELRDR